MKKTIIFSFCILSLFSCSRELDSHEQALNAERKEINIQAGVVETSFLRAGPINSSFSTNVPIGVYAHKNGIWTAGSSNLINNDPAVVDGALPHQVNFSSTYYYPIDGSTVNFYAFSPQGVESVAATSGSNSSNAPTVVIGMTGQEDIMWGTTAGTKSSAVPNLTFMHKLTQLQFTFISGTAFPTGTTVTSLLIKSQPTTAAINVQTGVCTFSGSANMQVIQGSPISIAVSPGTNANSPVMTEAGNPIFLDITVQPLVGSPYTYTNIPVSVTTVAGSSHMITLTFTSKQVGVTANVNPWMTGFNKNVTI